tara:strand:+ start:350 stop:676 length:327 start_codon:yes stop_codon:yes gene_type:complete
MIVNDGAIKFTFDNNFVWNKYEANFKKLVLQAKEPVHIIWDLIKMTKIPSISIISKQGMLLLTNKNKIKKKTLTNTILVSSNEMKSTIENILKTVYKPLNPTQVILKN